VYPPDPPLGKSAVCALIKPEPSLVVDTGFGDAETTNGANGASKLTVTSTIELNPRESKTAARKTPTALWPAAIERLIVTVGVN
jgi:hypothetical protein